MRTSTNRLCNGKNCFFLPLLIVGFFGISAIVMMLWNFVIPAITGFKVITYWQAIGLFALSRILFGGFKFRRHHQQGRAHIQQAHAAFKDRFMEMNDDEKLQFKNQWKNRCCK